MRSWLAKRIRKLFREGVISRFPALHEMRAEGLSPGSLLFVWPVEQQLEFGVELIIAPKWDVFHVELGWTTQGRWPIQRWFVDLDDDLLGSEGRIRLRRLMGKGLKDLGWEVSPVQLPGGRLISLEEDEPSTERLTVQGDQLIDDALHAMETVGVAFFSQVARAHDISLTITRER